MERIPLIKSRKQRSHEAPKWVFCNHPGGLTAVGFRPFCGSPTLSTVTKGGAILDPGSIAAEAHGVDRQRGLLISPPQGVAGTPTVLALAVAALLPFIAVTVAPLLLFIAATIRGVSSSACTINWKCGHRALPSAVK